MNRSLWRNNMASTKYPHFEFKMKVAILMCEIGSEPSFYCIRVLLATVKESVGGGGSH